MPNLRSAASAGSTSSTRPKSATPLVIGLLLLVAPLLALHQAASVVDARILVGGFVVINGLTSILQVVDKRRARAGGWRVSENTLHLFELVGGWPGALVAQQWLRHKTSKRSYQIVFWLIVLVQQLVAIDYLQDWRMSRAARDVIVRVSDGTAKP